MEKSVWLWMRAYWQVVATAMVVVWFLLASISGTEKSQLAAKQTNVSETTTITEPPTQNRATNTIAIATTTVASPAAPSMSANSGTVARTPTSALRSGGNGLYYPGSASATAVDGRVSTGDLTMKVKSAEAHRVDNASGQWEVNALVEVTNNTKSNKQFDPTRITARIGSGVAVYTSKPVVVDISPQMPVLIPLSFTTSSTPSTNFTLSYGGTLLSRGLTSGLVGR